jgi:cysteine desulfurase
MSAEVINIKKVYMDYAATTPVDPDVLKAMLPYFSKVFGNPSSIHSFGVDANEAVEKARKQIAELLHVKPGEVVFTSGGTEADNLAIKGIAFRHKDQRKHAGPHIITSAIEHPAVLETCKHLQQQGFDVHYLPVDHHGIIDVDDLAGAIGKHTFLISVMFANNEIGTIEPIEEIGKIAREHEIAFHTDAVQAVGKLPIDVTKLHIDALSLSSHKIYGPKGIGALILRKGIHPEPLFHGGGHENNLRSSTLNTPGIVGLGKAIQLIQTKMQKEIPHLTQLRDTLIHNISSIEESYLNGHPKQRLANNAHFRFTAIEGEALNLMLNDKGIAAATGSACSSKKLKPSHVLLAIGLKPEQAHGSLRLSLGRMSTKEDVALTSEALPTIVEKLRAMSPLWKK